MQTSTLVRSGNNRIIAARQSEKLGLIENLFLLFCLMPFILPNPIIVTDTQPYAAVFGTLVILRHLIKNRMQLITKVRNAAIIGFMTLVVSCVVLIAVGVSLNALRGVYNYYAVAIIPCAAALVVEQLGHYPERQIKVLITIWFVVSTVQFFVYRGFMDFIISGARWSYGQRGVLGLASEPSFFGIACFYFFHMIQRFQKHRVLFMLMTLIMGVVYAQSAMGLIFMVGFLVVLLMENTHGRAGRNLWIGAGIVVVLFFVLLNTALKNTRLYELYDAFVNGGTEKILSEDVSAENRAMSISKALSSVINHYFMPQGFGRRIGSGYGGFLVELGIFAVPVLLFISLAMSRTFRRPFSRIVYFVVATILLFNNTQLGNPLLLFVVGTNCTLHVEGSPEPQRTKEG